VLVAVAFFGMVNGMGRDRGPASVLEQSLLPATAPPADRTRAVLSHFAAAWLSRRIGLVNTMVWTHLPSSLLLPAIAFAPSFSLAAACHLLRECLVEMDVPTRTSYAFALVRPEERTAAAGWTNLTRLTSWAVGPAIAGALMSSVALVAPLLAAAAVKIAYDLTLWAAFRSVPPPEGSQRPSSPSGSSPATTEGVRASRVRRASRWGLRRAHL
jgi:hypothetical protein